MSSMCPNEWDCSITCFAKLDMWLLVLNTYLCSLNLAAKFRPFCPTYALLQSGQVNLYAPDKYARSRAYKLTYPDCNKVYVGQTG